MAKDIHEQGVGTGAGVEFAPLAGFVAWKVTASGVRLLEALSPFGALQDGGVGLRKEVTVREFVVGAGVNDDFVLAIA